MAENEAESVTEGEFESVIADVQDCGGSEVKCCSRCDKISESLSEFKFDQEMTGNESESVSGDQNGCILKDNGVVICQKGTGSFSEIKETQKMADNEHNVVCGVQNITGCFSKIKEKKEMVETVLNLVSESQNGESPSEMESKHELREMKLDFIPEAQETSEKVVGDFSEIKEKKEMVETVLKSVFEAQNGSRKMIGSTESYLKIEGKQEPREIKLIFISEDQGTSDKGVAFSDIKEKQEMEEIKPVPESDAQNDGEKNENYYTSCSLQNSSEINRKQEMAEHELGSISESQNGGKKKKSSRRRAKSTRNGSKISEKHERGITERGPIEIQNVCEKEEKGSKRSYFRYELLALRFVNVKEQDKKWNEIYLGLGSVARELDEIAATKQPKQGRKNIDRRQRFSKKKSAGILSDTQIHDPSRELFSQNAEKGLEEVHQVDFVHDESVTGKENCLLVQQGCDEDESSDDEYDSLQRPAFLVGGEPDFESGPPQDGLEYLRRVRWEAAQIPKVKVAKVVKKKLSSEQTAYMPNIPDIAGCPAHLLPSKYWEDEFLADFSELRMALSRIENSSEWTDCISAIDSGERIGIQCEPRNVPAVSFVLGLDSVSRAATLRNRINTFESASMLSRDNSLWVFALCAAVENPLSAETSASIRCLLRKCASLRAAKEEPDDDVVMLNILIAIAGKYFGQLEC